jgi:hypothetical protein
MPILGVLLIEGQVRNGYILGDFVKMSQLFKAVFAEGTRKLYVALASTAQKI